MCRAGSCVRTCATRRKGEQTGTIVIAEVVMVHLLQEVTAKSPHGKTIVDVNKLRPMSRCATWLKFSLQGLWIPAHCLVVLTLS